MLPMVKTLLADRFKLKVHSEMREMPVLGAGHRERTMGSWGRASSRRPLIARSAQAENQKLAEALAKGGPGALAGMLPKPGETRSCAMMPMMGADGFGMRADGQPLSVIMQTPHPGDGPDRQGQDRTDRALYDWEIKFDPQVLVQIASQVGINFPAGANLPASDSPSLLTALREDLGLKLDSERGQVEMLVIDSARDARTPN